MNNACLSSPPASHSHQPHPDHLAALRPLPPGSHSRPLQSIPPQHQRELMQTGLHPTVPSHRASRKIQHHPHTWIWLHPPSLQNSLPTTPPNPSLHSGLTALFPAKLFPASGLVHLLVPLPRMLFLCVSARAFLVAQALLPSPCLTFLHSLSLSQ